MAPLLRPNLTEFVASPRGILLEVATRYEWPSPKKLAGPVWLLVTCRPYR